MTEFSFDQVFIRIMLEHNLDTVVILGHLNPDGDAAGSVRKTLQYYDRRLCKAGRRGTGTYKYLSVFYK